MDRRAGDSVAVWAATETAERELGWKTKLDINDMCRDQVGIRVTFDCFFCIFVVAMFTCATARRAAAHTFAARAQHSASELGGVGSALCPAWLGRHAAVANAV